MVRPERLSLFLVILLHSCSHTPESPSEAPCVTAGTEEIIAETISPTLREFSPEEAFRESLEHGDREQAIELWIKEGPFSFPDPLEEENTLRRLFSRSLRYPSGMGNLSVLEIVGDDLWIGTWDGGVFRYALPLEEWALIMEPQPSLTVNTVFSIKPEGSTLWIMQYNRLLRYNRGTSSLEPLTRNPPAGRMKDLVFFEDQPWVGTALNGIYLRSAGELQWRQSFALQAAGSQINRLIPGSEGIWICTADRGLFFWDGSNLERVYKDLLPVNITAVEEWQGNLWVGTYGSGLFRIDLSGKLEHFSEKEGTLSDDWILSSKKTADYLFWGTLGGGISFFSTEGKKARLGLAEGLGSMDIADIEWYNNSLYAGTLGGGITVIHETLLDFRLQNP